METHETLTRKFTALGADVQIADPAQDRRMRHSMIPEDFFRIDVQKQGKGEIFKLFVRGEVDLQVLDVNKDDRHLLLMAKTGNGRDQVTSKFLCGHDERHWFTAAIPAPLFKGKPVSTVGAAKQALKPIEVIEAEQKGAVKPKDLQKRHRRMADGGKIHRQGEFMFIPEPALNIDKDDFRSVIHRNEPMRRGRANKPHMAQYLYRQGGVSVMVCRQHPNGITEGVYRKLLQTNPTAKMYAWSRSVRDAVVYVKGKISHADHATLDLGDVWHRVLLSEENRAKGFENVAFLD